MQNTIGLYQPATAGTLNTIRQRNQAGKATFLLSSQPVFAESAQAAYLLCKYINSTRNNGAGEIYKTFFCNSRIEALHGAIKISRHNARFGRSDSDGTVLVYDERGYYDALFDPLRRGPEQALVPGVFFYGGLSDLFDHLEKPGASICAVVVCLSDERSVVSLSDIQERCKQKNTIVAIDTSHGSDSLSEIAERSPLLKEIRGEGLHLHLVLDMEKFPLSLFGITVSELLISRLCVSEGHVLQFFCRLLPPLSISDAEARELTTGIEKAFGIGRFSLFVFGMKRMIVFAYFLMADRLTNGTKRFLRQVAGFGV